MMMMINIVFRPTYRFIFKLFKDTFLHSKDDNFWTANGCFSATKTICRSQILSFSLPLSSYLEKNRIVITLYEFQITLYEFVMLLFQLKISPKKIIRMYSRKRYVTFTNIVFQQDNWSHRIKFYNCLVCWTFQSDHCN